MVLTAAFAGDRVSLIDYGRDQINQLAREDHTGRRHGEKLLRCVVCRGPLHVCHVSRTLIIFRHDPGHRHGGIRPAGESGRHDALKILFCDAVEAVPGWHAEPEYRLDAEDPDIGGQAVVDVYAANGDTAHGFEVQLSPATGAAVARRQEIRLAAGLRQCVWATDTEPAWHRDTPWVLLDGDESPHIVDGIVGDWSDTAGDYEPVPPLTLRRFARRQLDDRLMWIPDLGRLRDPTASDGEPRRPGRRRDQPHPDEHNPTLDCDRPTWEPQRLDRSWRPVPNLPGTPQISESRDRLGRVKRPRRTPTSQRGRMGRLLPGVGGRCPRPRP